MTNAATARPARTTTTHYVGMVVIADDQRHTDTDGRPHLVVDVRGDQLLLAELTHTEQGQWRTDLLPTAAHDYSYLMLVHWRSGEWLPEWHHAATTRRYGRQLPRAVAAEAVAYVDRVYMARR